MVKLTYCVRRRADLSPDSFRKYWLKKHAPLVRKHAAALGARRYVQSHTMDTKFNEALQVSRGAAAAFDGITEVWWDSLEDFSTALATPEARRAGQELLEDERNFIDLAASSLFLTQEHTVF